MDAFSEAVLAAEKLVREGRLAEALAAYRAALKMADNDFKKYHVAGEIALVLKYLGQFQEAVSTLLQALDWAQRCSWRPHVEKFHSELANLYCHLGRFAESEQHFQSLLEFLKEKGRDGEWIRQSQNLGMAYLEQAKYSQALQVFSTAENFFEQRGAVFERALAKMQLAQVYSFLGMATAGQAQMETVQEILRQDGLAALKPFWNMLEGKFEVIQGHLGAAFHCFEEAAQDFEKIGDPNGKVEVFLSISGPLLELNLIRQVQQLVDQIAVWEDLKHFPALEHSVRLRRFVLAAFSGQAVQQDMELLLKERVGVGRAEDWMQFWLYLSLAARKLGQIPLMKDFLEQAKKIADRIAQDLTSEQKNHFLRRPDIARLWRLTEGAPSQETQKVRPQRGLTGEGPADAGIFAPPKREK